MTISGETARRLAAARDITAVLVFCVLVFFGARAVFNAPFLQKERLTRREAQGEIAVFFGRIEKLHPRGPSSPTAGGYAAMKSSAAAQAEARLDEFGRIKVRDLAYALYLSAAAFRDGNTRVLWQPPHKWKDPELRFPPFSVTFRHGKFMVENSLDPSLAGAELLDVNGTPFADLIGPALQRISGETAEYRAYLFCRDQAFWWDFSGVFSGDPRITAKLRTPAGKVQAKSMAPITAGEFRRMTWRAPAVRKEIYAQKKVAWLNVPSLDSSRSERRLYDRFFRELGGQGTEDLVLDMRETSGGDIRGADYLLAFVGGRPGGSARKFPGRTILLIGPGSGPAAACFAESFRGLRAGEILGEQTGGTPGHFGAPETFTLPDSGIRFTVSTRRYPGAEAPVRPDLALTAEVLRPCKGDLKTFILDRIAKERARNSK